jgi:hypothetical protein
MTMLRSLAILSVVAAATSDAACGTIRSSEPDGGVDSPGALSTSCKTLLEGNSRLDTGTYTLHTATGASYQAYCDMEHASGGWTLVLKVDGGASSSKFGYDNALWTNTMTLQEDKANLSRIEAKFSSFSEVGFSKIRVVMVETQAAEVMLDVTGASLMSLMRGPFVAVARPRQEWLNLVSGAVVQPNCNRSGINNSSRDPYVRVRIGMLANQEADCVTPDSFIGIGGGGGAMNGCFPGQGPGAWFVPPSAGSVSGGSCNPTPGSNHATFAYIYVR